MSGYPYHVEILTWNTAKDRGEGLGAGIKSNVEGENFGHASLEISLPYSDVTENWIEQYCKNIELYKSQRRGKYDEFVANVPVFYTTSDGLRVENPKNYLTEHPKAQIVTHVYLSWVPGNYVPLNDDRDPFRGAGKRNFNLFDSNRDKLMEHQGEHTGFRRGYQGVQLIEKKTKKDEDYITQGIREVNHLTPAQTRFFAMTPGERKWFEENINLLEKVNKAAKSPAIYLEEIKAALLEKTIHKEDADVLAELCEKYPVIQDFLEREGERYCQEKHIEDFETLTDEEKEEFAVFLESLYPEQLMIAVEEMIAHVDDLTTIKLNLDAEKFEDIYDDIEKMSPSVEHLAREYDEIFSNLNSLYEILDRAKDAQESLDEAKESGEALDPTWRVHIREGNRAKQAIKQQLEKISSDFPQLIIFRDEIKEEDEKAIDYFRTQFKLDFDDYLACTEEIKRRKMGQSLGTEPDYRILLPLGDINEAAFKGHPEGFDVHNMLKAIPQIVGDGDGYALKYKNCSDFVQKLCREGAPDNLKYLFNRHALGTAVTPQVVANDANDYANIIYDKAYQVGKARQGFFSKIYLDQENKAGEIFNHIERLKERIESQDEVINYIIQNKNNPNDPMLQNPDFIAGGIFCVFR